jgi:hypothetical protein
MILRDEGRQSFLNLDLPGRDETLEESENLADSDVLAQEIVEEPRTSLEFLAKMAACALIVPIFLFGLGIWLLSNDLERNLAFIFSVGCRYEGNI